MKDSQDFRLKGAESESEWLSCWERQKWGTWKYKVTNAGANGSLNAVKLRSESCYLRHQKHKIATQNLGKEFSSWNDDK